MSYIPGEVGASAIQNIGAYGVEVKDIIHEVKAVDVETCESRTFRNAECRYGYRSSVFKHDWKGRYIVTSVVYRLQNRPSYIWIMEICGLHCPAMTFLSQMSVKLS